MKNAHHANVKSAKADTAVRLTAKWYIAAKIKIVRMRPYVERKRGKARMKTNAPDCNIVHRRARGCGKRRMLVFVVIFRGTYLIQQGTQIDDGAAALAYANKKGYEVRIWPMYGLEHFCELPSDLKEEIASFIKGLR